MRDRFGVALVSYLNTLPYKVALQGMESDFDILEANPAECSRLLASREVDLGLVPLGAFLENEDRWQLVGQYGICCDGRVNTVILYSDVEIEEVDCIYLDAHSRTSAKLTKILCANHWGITPTYRHESTVSDLELVGREAKLMIGDKVFNVKNDYKFSYDLGAVWKDMTGLPFVFAVWAARRGESQAVTFSKRLDQQMAWTLRNLKEVVGFIEVPSFMEDTLEVERYLSEDIKYHLTDGYMAAIDLFKELIKKGGI